MWEPESSRVWWDGSILLLYERLQGPENIVFFSRTISGDLCITREVIPAYTVGYSSWVKNYATRSR